MLGRTAERITRALLLIDYECTSSMERSWQRGQSMHTVCRLTVPAQTIAQL